MIHITASPAVVSVSVRGAGTEQSEAQRLFCCLEFRKEEIVEIRTQVSLSHCTDSEVEAQRKDIIDQ